MTNHARFQELRARHVEDCLGFDEAAELEALLRSSADRRSEFTADLELHRVLTQRWHEDADVAAIMRRIHGASGTPADAGRSESSRGIKDRRRIPSSRVLSCSRSSRRQRLRTFSYVVAIAATLVAAVALWQLVPSPSRQAPLELAHVSAGDDLTIVRGQSTFSGSIGTKLIAGDRLLRPKASNGWRTPPVISYDDGSTLALDENTDISLASGGGKRLTLTSGEICIEAANQHADFPWVISTSMAEATVIGTTLSLSLLDGVTTLRVAEGRVKFSSHGTEVMVASGEASSADGGSAPAPARPYAAGSFVPWRLAPVAPVAQSGNLLENSGFEKNLAGWTAEPDGKRPTMEIVSTQAHEGRCSLKVGPVHGQQSLFQVVQVSAGTTYEVSCWARVIDTTPPNALIRLSWEDARGTVIDAGETENFSADTWTQTSGSFTAPPGATSLRVRLRMHNTNRRKEAYFWFDDCVVRKSDKHAIPTPP